MIKVTDTHVISEERKIILNLEDIWHVRVDKNSATRYSLEVLVKFTNGEIILDISNDKEHLIKARDGIWRKLTNETTF